jgi:hypothetical protein
MRRLTASTLSLVLVSTSLAIGSTALAQAGAFSFKSVEFMDASQREPAAKAFIHDNIQPGMPMGAALKIVRKAGGFCHKPEGGQVLCTHSSQQRHPGHGLTDVLWTVTITANPDGTVGGADVARTTRG